MNTPAPDLAELAAVAAFAPHLAQAFASLACDVALVLDGKGLITRVAHSPGSTLATATADWVGRSLADTVTADTRHKIDSLLAEVAADGLARRREVNLPVAEGPTIPLAFTALRLGPEGPSLAVGHDLRAVALMQQRFMRVQQELERGYNLALRTAGRVAPGAEASAFSDPELSTTPEVTEKLNEASRAAFAAWLRAERLVADGSATLPRGTRKPSPRRKR